MLPAAGFSNNLKQITMSNIKKQTTITIDGKEYPVVFNMAAAIIYEQTAGKPFFGEDFTLLYYRVILIYAAMAAADGDATVDALIQTGDWKGISEAFIKVAGMAAEFFKVPEVEKEDAQEDTGGDSEKNA